MSEQSAVERVFNLLAHGWEFCNAVHTVALELDLDEEEKDEMEVEAWTLLKSRAIELKFCEE